MDAEHPPARPAAHPTKCARCDYERKPTDTAPDWQCPWCGTAYAKFSPGGLAQAQAPRSGRTKGAHQDAAAAAEVAAVRRRGLIKLAGGGLIYLVIIAYVASKGGLSKMDGGIFGGIACAMPGVLALTGLFELVAGVSFDSAAEWWDALAGWQRGVYGVAILLGALVLMMVGIMMFR